MGAVAASSSAAVDLAADRRVGAAEIDCDSPRRASAGDPSRDLLALMQAQATFGSPAGSRPDASGSSQVVADASLRQTEPAADLAVAHPFRPQVPDRVLGRLAQSVAPWHSAPPSLVSSSLTLVGGAAEG